jgi:hypothetical protein
MNYPERPLDPPEVELYTGRVTFPARLGDGLVEVRCYVDEDELVIDTAQVWYCGTDISNCLEQPQWDRIQKEFDDNRWDIVTFGAED